MGRQNCEVFDVSSSGFTLADYFDFIYIHEVDVSDVGANDESVPFGFVGEGRDSGMGVYFLEHQAPDVIKVPVLVSLEDGQLAVLRSTEDHLLSCQFFN